MTKSKIYKISALVAVLLVAVIGYLMLPTRHKAIIKTTVLHKLRIIDNDWGLKREDTVYRMISPAFLIDGIYKSMEGPKASNYIQLSRHVDVLWLKSFSVTAINAKTNKKISNDYICHTNVDFNDLVYYRNFNLSERIGRQYPRMTSLSHGQETFAFPKGFGVPMKGTDILFVTTQTLNHNKPDINLQVKHEVDINYTRQNLKPLMSRTAFVMLPYDKNDPFKEPLDPASNQCIPVETKNHSYDDGTGNMLSGHWVIPKGKNTYRSMANSQLQIKDSLRLHAAAIHVHPFATSIALFDKTENKPVFVSKITNYKDRIGLEKIEQFTSEAGVWLYKDHDYEIILTVDNTTNEQQDMMGSMFLFFYDKELDAILNKK